MTARRTSRPASPSTARFGIRQVGTARKRITLNGRPVYLRGVNRHEAHAEFGAATSRQLMYEDLANIRALGGNFVRGAHDPRGRAQYTEDYQAEYTRAMLEEVFANLEIAGIAIWQYSDAKTYTRRHTVHARSYGVNTGGLYDLYRRPKMAVDVVRELFWASRAKEPISTDGAKMSQLTERERLN